MAVSYQYSVNSIFKAKSSNQKAGNLFRFLTSRFKFQVSEFLCAFSISKFQVSKEYPISNTEFPNFKYLPPARVLCCKKVLSFQSPPNNPTTNNLITKYPYPFTNISNYGPFFFLSCRSVSALLTIFLPNRSVRIS